VGLLAFASPTHADPTSGRQAYERGDYQRAMQEWQAAADHNDPEAEFGVGTLYAFGAGELKQDYTRAADWYKRAATHGNTGAEYRLALLYAAGGEDFEGDLVEAYKWASLAAQSGGVWGTLAVDLVKQLEKVTTIGQQADGIKRAADWKSGRKKDRRTAVTAVARDRPTIPVARLAVPDIAVLIGSARKPRISRIRLDATTAGAHRAHPGTLCASAVITRSLGRA
jgi:hypothetical protein